MSVKETVAKRFAAAGLSGGCFSNVKDGEKKSIDHDSRWDDPREVPGQNYGIYADADDQLVVLDVDYHREGSDDVSAVALASLSGLPSTLKLNSPHVPDEGRGGHRVYKLAGDEPPGEFFARRFGPMNPVPSWGEVIAKNKYVVGAGSQLDGCDKEWCDECATDGGGHYGIKEDRPIATVDPEDLAEALNADPDLSDSEATDGRSGTHHAGDYDDLTREQVEEMLAELPGDQRFDDWIRTGYAVYSWDNTETGKRVFEEWSRGNQKWEEEESQRQIDYIWKEGDSSDGPNNAGIGTLIYLAQEHGWGPAGDDEEKSMAELVAEYSDEYDDPAEVPANLLDRDGAAETASPPAERDASDDSDPWRSVRTLYSLAQQEDGEVTKGEARRAAAAVLEDETAWMYVLESERLWVYDARSGTYSRFGAAEVGRYLVDNLGEYYSQTERREIIGQIEDRNQVHREVLNARQRDDPLVCVGNGVVNLRTGELADHSPRYRFVRGLSWDFAPENADPDRILDFLDDVTQREADRDTLLDHLAHGLMPGHPYRAFVVCYGPGGNGKTQVAELFRGFVGDENAAAVEIDELTNDDFATGDLPGKFINWGDDMAGDGGGTLDDLTLLKKATGGSEIRANEKFEKTFDFKNEAAMFFSANEPPRIGERKRSMQDRIYPIEMPYRFKSSDEVDPDDPLEKPKTTGIADEILADDAAMRGLLALAVDHAQKLIDNGGRYSQPESPEERLEKYNKSADPIVKFAGKALEPADGGSKIRKDDAYRVYRNHVESWGERAASKRGFKRQFPGAFPGEIETARSRVLATPDDEKDRVRCWKRLQWTDRARQHMPAWLAERYSDHFDDPAGGDDGGDGDGGSRDAGPQRPEFAGLEPGRHDLTVTVAETMEPKPWQQDRGHVVDGAGNIMKYVAEGSTNPMANVEEGDRIEITNAKLETDRDGVLQLSVSGVCEVTVANRDEGQAPLDDDESAHETAADGGEEGEAVGPRADGDKIARVMHKADAVVGSSEAMTPAEIAGKRTDMDPDRIKQILREQSRFSSGRGDRYRVSD